MISSTLIQQKITEDGDSVSVWKEIKIDKNANSFTQYRKKWISNNLNIKKSWLSWAHHEHLILSNILRKRIPYVVTVSDLHVENNQVDLVTIDAGLELQKDLIDVHLKKNYLSIIGDEIELLKLSRACLVALDNIHSSGIIHCDFKADNICISMVNNQSLNFSQINYDSIKLIDFAFSIYKDEVMEFVLPTDSSRLNYLPHFYKKILLESQEKNNPNLIHKAACPQIDMYSLGVMFQNILETNKSNHMPHMTLLIKKLMEGASENKFNFLKYFNLSNSDAAKKNIHYVESLLTKLQVPNASWNISKKILNFEINKESFPREIATPLFQTPILSANNKNILTPIYTPQITLLDKKPNKDFTNLEVAIANIRYKYIFNIIFIAFIFILLDRFYSYKQVLIDDLDFYLSMFDFIIFSLVSYKLILTKKIITNKSNVIINSLIGILYISIITFFSKLSLKLI